ncbi:MAG TPA: hypothetical protein VMH80_21590 [Bryobacteraceae bacterium]|nr:hypothetical protein [Bryobacteraceae bacterium]
MRHLILSSIVGSGLLLFATAASAQQTPRAFAGSQDRDAFLARVQTDLDRAAATADGFNGDRTRIDRARDEVSEFEQQMDDGNYSPSTLTDTIVSLQRIVDNNRLYERVRTSVSDDLIRLRDMRDHYEHDYDRP